MDTDYQSDKDWLLNIQRKLYAWSRIPTTRCKVLESPVHNERCPPGSGAGAGETTAGNRGIGAPAPCSLTKPARPLRDTLESLERAWERYRQHAAAATQTASTEERPKVQSALHQHASALLELAAAGPIA